MKDRLYIVWMRASVNHARPAEYILGVFTDRDEAYEAGTNNAIKGFLYSQVSHMDLNTINKPGLEQEGV